MFAKTILPVVLVGIASMLALSFMITHFANEGFGNDVFTAYAGFDRMYSRPFVLQKPLLFVKQKEVCVFQNAAVDCENQKQADAFCYIMMNIIPDSPKPTAAKCTSGFVTCELPCGAMPIACRGSNTVKRMSKNFKPCAV